jgi:hypothetical protein
MRGAETALLVQIIRQQRGQGNRQHRNTGRDWQGMPDLDCSN